MNLSIIVPILFLVISIILLITSDKEEPLVKTLEFYPPEGFNSAEIAFLHRGYSIKQEVVSLLIYLANKGYIKIRKKGISNSNNNFVLTKVKEYYGNNMAERIFFEGLFSKKDEVMFNDLNEKFYKIADKITCVLGSKENKEEIFQKSSLRKRTIVLLSMILTFIIITYKPVIEHGGVKSLLWVLFFIGISSLAMIVILVYNKTSKLEKFFMITFCGVFIVTPFIYIIVPAIIKNKIYIITYILGILCIAGMGIVFKKLKKRTKYGNEILGRILGFKDFLKNAEKEKLEELVSQNPNYFYDMLPFAYVFDLSDKWIKKFKDISIKAPDWYDETSFGIVDFETFMKSTMKSILNAMVSVESSGD